MCSLVLICEREFIAVLRVPVKWGQGLRWSVNLTPWQNPHIQLSHTNMKRCQRWNQCTAGSVGLIDGCIVAKKCTRAQFIEPILRLLTVVGITTLNFYQHPPLFTLLEMSINISYRLIVIKRMRSMCVLGKSCMCVGCDGIHVNSVSKLHCLKK